MSLWSVNEKSIWHRRQSRLHQQRIACLKHRVQPHQDRCTIYRSGPHRSEHLVPTTARQLPLLSLASTMLFPTSPISTSQISSLLDETSVQTWHHSCTLCLELPGTPAPRWVVAIQPSPPPAAIANNAPTPGSPGPPPQAT